MSGVVTCLNAALEGRYRIECELGEGGMPTVYLADDIKHERKVALKVLKPELAAVVRAERFLAEIKTRANLQHPHILPLFDSGEADSYVFYVMPHVEDESLRGRIEREKMTEQPSGKLYTAVTKYWPRIVAGFRETEPTQHRTSSPTRIQQRSLVGRTAVSVRSRRALASLLRSWT